MSNGLRITDYRSRITDRPIVCIIGLGYVGLPLAEAFSKHLKVIAFDIDQEKVKRLNESNNEGNIEFTSNPSNIREADFVLICVPTPVTKSKEPDLSYVKKAAEIVGENMKRGTVVILESTVYPGVTEEIMKPILEEKSEKMGLNTKDVLDAAVKWNFQLYKPGLVGEKKEKRHRFRVWYNTCKGG